MKQDNSRLTRMLQVTNTYNGTDIILFTYPLESNPGLALTPNYLQYMTSLYVAAQKAGMSNVYLLQIDGIDFPTDNWCVAHPNLAAHAAMANQLISYIQAVLPSWANTSYPVVATNYTMTS